MCEFISQPSKGIPQRNISPPPPFNKITLGWKETDNNNIKRIH